MEYGSKRSGTMERNYPQGDKSKKIIVCDTDNNQLHVLTSSGQLVRHIEGFDEPEDIAMSNRGHLAVWNRGSKTISIWGHHCRFALLTFDPI